MAEKHLERDVAADSNSLTCKKKKKSTVFFYVFNPTTSTQSFSLLYAIFLFTQIFTVATDYNEHTR